MATSSPADRHIVASRQRLGHLAGMAGKTEAAERTILSAAEARLSVVQNRLAKLHPRVLTDIEAADEYTSLMIESGQLRGVIGQSRQVLDR